MKRPTGVTIIAVIYILLAVLSLLWSGLVFGVGGLTTFFGGLFGAESIAAFGTSSAWTGFVGIIAAIVQFVIAIGLLSMQKWAWFLALIGVALTVIEGLIGLFSGGALVAMCSTLGLIVPIAMLIYLLLSSVRSAFGVGST